MNLCWEAICGPRKAKNRDLPGTQPILLCVVFRGLTSTRRPVDNQMDPVGRV
jgi:hypothetical protein